MLLTSSWTLDFLIVCTTFLFLIYKYFTRNFNYWKKKGIIHPKPIPLFGNLYETFTFKKTVHEIVKTYWDKVDAPYFGFFIFDEPVLVLKSPKLIKDVLIKNFTVFRDRRVATPDHITMAHSVFFLKYDHWKKIRIKLTPLFTSAMLKNMYTHLKDINENVSNYLTDHIGVLDVRYIGGSFSTEMIARCFYGINPHCFDQDVSVFRKYTHKMSDFNVRNGIIQNLFFLKPSLVNMLKLDFVEREALNYFKETLTDSLTKKADYNGKPQNFIDLTNKAIKEQNNNGSSEYDIAVSNAIFLLIAGQETTTTIISFTLYELAMNQTIQDRLRQEIKANVEKYGGLTYDGISENKYLKMCLNESMRKYPALLFLDRMPITDYRFEDTDLVIEKGTSVLIPFYSLQRDEMYFPNSEKYDPDRFLDDNVNSDGLNFIPFGEGPRGCIGKRLGTLALEMAVANVILKFKLEKCDKTPEKIEFDPKSFALLSKVGLPLKIAPV